VRRFELTRRPISAELARRSAAESDTDIIYSEPGIYCHDGEPVIIYGRLEQRHDKMLWAVRTFGFSPDTRGTHGGNLQNGITRGREITGESRIFGFAPPVAYNPLANFCRPASSYQSHPAQHSVICEFGSLLTSIYQAAAPEVAARHTTLLKGTRPEWVLPGTLFTSGIVNKNNSLKYHLDRGNLESVMSCMVVFRQFCEGGYLSIPEFNARWMLDDHSYFLFDGQSYLHGVTPIKRLNKKAYRHSVVYYALRAMEKCGSVMEELSRARAEKRAREQRRV
jgi:hypothetical protein